MVRFFFASLVRRVCLFDDPVGNLRVKKQRGIPRGVLSEAEARRLEDPRETTLFLTRPGTRSCTPTRAQVVNVGADIRYLQELLGHRSA